MKTFAEQIRDYFNSPEAQAEIERQQAHREHVAKINEKWLGKFRNLSHDERIALLEKIRTKYDSDEYYHRYTKQGIFPIYGLYHLLEEYFIKYGVEVFVGEWEVEYELTSAWHLLDEDYILRRVDSGMGPSYTLRKVGEEEVVPHKMLNPVFAVYSPSGKCVLRTRNKVIYDDVLNQIGKKRLQGFKGMVDDRPYHVVVDGLGRPNLTRYIGRE